MQAPLFIVWRESLEALLIIGILYNWLRRENLSKHIILLWYGTFLGIILAVILALIFWLAGQWFSGPQGEWFFIIMTGCAALLILQMISWIHRHASNMKANLEKQAAQALKERERWGLILLTMIAVAREGSETVVFLAGIGSAQQHSLSLFIFGAFLGLLLALFSFWFLQKFTNLFAWKWFFRLTEYLLLLIGGGLFMSSCDKLISQLMNFDLPDWLYDFLDRPLWDSSWLLADRNSLTAFTGYHSMPSFMQLMALLLYWASAFYLIAKAGKKLYPQAKIAQNP